ncbi:MAG TPA: BamA/TamA family outer membrane protein [Bacteroidales bacterium]|nr:BamA/TamA family outer membrane protein [Bacteroidales bacterium]HPS62153.1 BamA/TamA family outer membrane protein [Bacteroidales bacterium]
MWKSIFRISFILILLQWINTAKGQDLIYLADDDSASWVGPCPQQDIFDILTREKLKAPSIPSRKARAIILPLIAFTPATALQLGAGASVSWTIGKKRRTKLSAGSVQVLWTTEKQLISYIRTHMFFNDNKWSLLTDWRWYLFRLPTYGLGTGSTTNIPLVKDLPGTANEPVSYEGGRFPMKYNWIKVHNTLFIALAGNLYAGLGFHLDHYYDIKDEKLNLDSSTKVITPHFAYCARHGFNYLKYTASGVSFNLAWDTRDNIINPYRGSYAGLSYQYNLTYLGSDRPGSRLWAEFRTYIGLSRRSHRHLLALRTFGCFKTSGELPYLNLMSAGFDPVNSSGRGYVQGRWRGDDFIYGEAEYRFPISACSGIVGGVLFANATTASNRDMHDPLFRSIRPGAGFGLRIMVGKADRTNLLIDFGLGYLSQGLYLQAQEVY